jgi:hypothetical protein
MFVCRVFGTSPLRVCYKSNLEYELPFHKVILLCYLCKLDEK